MKLENQVCTFEQGVKLFNRGIIGSIYFHVHDRCGNYIGISNSPTKYQKKICIPAFTVAELGVMLPVNIITARQKHTDTYACIVLKDGSSDVDYSKDIQHKDTEAQARAAMLIYLLENGHTTAEEVNQRLINN